MLIYVLWPPIKKFKNWIVDWSTAHDFTVFVWDQFWNHLLNVDLVFIQGSFEGSVCVFLGPLKIHIWGWYFLYQILVNIEVSFKKLRKCSVTETSTCFLLVIFAPVYIRLQFKIICQSSKQFLNISRS